jgi:TrmH family RNA methyltransferase
MTKPFPKKIVSSEQNGVFRELRDCLASKGIRKHGLYIVSGERAVAELLESRSSEVRDLLICADFHGEDHSLVRQFYGKTAESRATLIELSRALFEELDLFGTKEPLLVLRTPELQTADLSAAPNGLEVLCAMGDPANVGALIRSAAAFGATKIVLLKESASPFHPKATRAASATTRAVILEKGPSIHEIAGTSVVALDMKGESLFHFRWPKDCRLLIGEEGPGVPNKSSFTLVSIPMAATVESLNATVAASIALYSYRSTHS